MNHSKGPPVGDAIHVHVLELSTPLAHWPTGAVRPHGTAAQPCTSRPTICLQARRAQPHDSDTGAIAYFKEAYARLGGAVDANTVGIPPAGWSPHIDSLRRGLPRAIATALDACWQGMRHQRFSCTSVACCGQYSVSGSLCSAWSTHTAASHVCPGFPST